MGTNHRTLGKKLPRYSKFLQERRNSFSHHWTYDELWAMLLGDKLPSKAEQHVLLTHFRSHGWNVSPRDFIRGTAASNHPMFINLRMLRRTLRRSELDALFFAGNLHEKGLDDAQAFFQNRKESSANHPGNA